MRSARIVSPGRIELLNEDTPILENNKILVKLLRTVICGSDLPYFSVSYDPKSYPFPTGYPGHECLGVIEESRCSEFETGNYVMYYPESLDGFKEFHLTEASRLQKIPEDGDLNVLVMTQLLGAVSHCVFRLDKLNNRSVVVLGQGPVGLLFTALLKNFGAKNVIVVDPIEFRLDVAKKMGADFVINPQKNDVVKSVPEMNDGELADIVVEAFGQDVNLINSCFDLARHNGQVAFFGICLEESPGLNFNTFFRKELRMVASVGPNISIDYPFALDMILRGSIDVSPLITHVMPFEEIQKGFDIASNKLDNVIKIILKF